MDKIISSLEEKYSSENRSLTPEDKATKLAECNLDQFSKASYGDSLEDVVVNEFFGNQDFSAFTSGVPVYINNIMQFCMKDFFKSIGFTFVKDFGMYAGAFITKSKKYQIEYDKGKFVEGFLDAFLFFESESTDEKICVRVSKDNYDVLHYFNIFSSYKNDVFEEWKEYAIKNNFYKGKNINPDCDFLNLDENISWDDVIITKEVKNIIQRNVKDLFEKSEILEKNGINLKRGVILTGPPGTGKTMICKVLAKDLPVTVLYVLPSHIRNPGDVVKICDMAKDLAPTLLILEDIDYIASDRGDGNNWFVIDLMNKMDGIESFQKVVTVATTNLADKVENAIKNRPGRFDRIVKVDNPNTKMIAAMLKKFTERYQLDKEIDFDAYAEEIGSDKEEMSGAYIKDLCITAVFLAIQAGDVDENDLAVLSYEHFDAALDEIKNKDFTNLSENSFSPVGFGAESAAAPRAFRRRR